MDRFLWQHVDNVNNNGDMWTMLCCGTSRSTGNNQRWVKQWNIYGNTRHAFYLLSMDAYSTITILSEFTKCATLLQSHLCWYALVVTGYSICCLNFFLGWNCWLSLQFFYRSTIWNRKWMFERTVVCKVAHGMPNDKQTKRDAVQTGVFHVARSLMPVGSLAQIWQSLMT